MLSFQPVRTARFTFQLKELTLGEIRQLLNIPPNQIEKARTAFLNFALQTFNWHKGYEQLSLAHLTVQERIFIETTYISASSKMPDFTLGESKYSDYLQIESQYQHNQLELGTMEDDEDIWHIQPVTGAMIEVIEERLIMKETAPHRVDWILYAMAAQLLRQNENNPNPYHNGDEYGDWLEKRVNHLQQLPESLFLSLMKLFFVGQQRLSHLFNLNFDEQGVVVMPNQEEGEIALSSARFRPTATICMLTKQLLGKY